MSLNKIFGNALQIVRKYVLDQIEFNVKKQRQYYNLNRKEVVFGVGNAVLWRKDGGRLQKPKMLGPYRVAKLLPPRDLELYDMTNDKYFVVHEEDVFPYQSRSLNLPSPKSDGRDIVIAPPVSDMQTDGPSLQHRTTQSRGPFQGVDYRPWFQWQDVRNDGSYEYYTSSGSGETSIKQETSEPQELSRRHVTFDLKEGTRSAETSPRRPAHVPSTQSASSESPDATRTCYGRRIRPPVEFWKTQG